MYIIYNILLAYINTYTHNASLFKFFKKVIIYLAVPGLSYNTRDLRFSLQSVGSLVGACKLLPVAHGI